MDISDVLYVAGLLVPTHLRNIKDGCLLITSTSLYHNVSKLLLCWTTQKYGWSSYMDIPNGFVNGRIACTFSFTHVHDGYLLMHDCSNVTAIQHLAGIKQTSKLLFRWNFAALLEFRCFVGILLLLYCERNTK